MNFAGKLCTADEVDSCKDMSTTALGTWPPPVAEQDLLHWALSPDESEYP